MKITPAILTLMILLWVSNLTAQSFTLSGELRPRLELRHGYRTLPPDDAELAAFVSQRSRLNLLYESPQFNTFICIQDVRVWGDKGMFEVQPGIGVHQAYAEIPFLKKFSAKVGRQEIRLNNQRLFGINNWNQAGRTHDAAVLSFLDKGWKVKLGAAFNQTSEENFGTYYSGGEYKSLNFIWFEKMFGNIGISGIAVADGFQQHTAKSERTYFRFTYGGIIGWQAGKKSLEMHAFLQSGETNAGKTISAWYLAPVGRLKLSNRLNMLAGAEIFSGNDHSKNEEKFKVFVPLYGANHVFNGHLDYFTNIPQHTRNAGLVNPFLNFLYQASDKVIVKADYHYFALKHGSLPGSPEVDKYLGSEIDLSVQFVFSKQLDLQVGYSTMFASETMELLKQGSSKEPTYWGWVMLTVKPVFFTSGSKN